MKNRACAVGILVVVMLAACGGDDANYDEGDESAAYESEVAASIAKLPDDFPSDLIPPEFTSSTYTDMSHINGTRGASFESEVSVHLSVDHYVDILGEPTIDVDAGEGERSVQWNETPWPNWVIGVIGNDSETIVAVSKLPEQ